MQIFHLYIEGSIKSGRAEHSNSVSLVMFLNSGGFYWII